MFFSWFFLSLHCFYLLLFHFCLPSVMSFFTFESRVLIMFSQIWISGTSVYLCIILGSINTKSSRVLCKQSGLLQILTFFQYPTPWNLLRYPYPYFLVHTWNSINYYPILQMKTSFWYYWATFDICKWTVQIDIIVGPI